MDRRFAAFARGSVVATGLVLAACQGGESGPGLPAAATSPTPVTAARTTAIPPVCLSPMQALTNRSRQTWDKMIGDPAYQYDSKAESDFTKVHLSAYLKAGCKEKPGADLGDCIADGIESGLPSVMANHSLHDRCFAAFLAGY